MQLSNIPQPQWVSEGNVCRICVYVDESFCVFHIVNKPKRDANEDKLLSLDMGEWGKGKVK